MPSHINQSRHFSNHQYISIAPIHFEEKYVLHLFFPLLRQRKTTFLWRNAILKVPSWLQAHNSNEMELLICQLCVHVRHPLANEYVLVIKETRYITWAFCILCSVHSYAHTIVLFLTVVFARNEQTCQGAISSGQTIAQSWKKKTSLTTEESHLLLGQIIAECLPSKLQSA